MQLEKMWIKEINLQFFRNYESLHLDFHNGLTIITGENAQGKTNLLEAIFLLSMAKSHRTHQDLELIQWGQDQAFIQGVVENRHYEFPLEISLNAKGKIAKLNHIEQKKLSHFVGKFNVILFAPEDLQLVKGSPSLRRRFLNSELGQAHPVYLQELLNYERILKQRNTYLKEYGISTSFDPIYFEIITEQFIKSALEIIAYRCEFVEKLNSLIDAIHYELSNQRDHLILSYQASSSKLDYQKPDQIENQFKELFKQVLEREKRQGSTVYGPHRDDLIFNLNGNDARNFASQGQQRTIVLSMKLAEIEWLRGLIGEYPVLLLDDVLSELDENRQLILMEQIESKVQTFLTTASINHLHFKSLNNAEIIYVENGKISMNQKGE